MLYKLKLSTNFCAILIFAGAQNESNQAALSNDSQQQTQQTNNSSTSTTSSTTSNNSKVIDLEFNLWTRPDCFNHTSSSSSDAFKKCKNHECNGSCGNAHHGNRTWFFFRYVKDTLACSIILNIFRVFRSLIIIYECRLFKEIKSFLARNFAKLSFSFPLSFLTAFNNLEIAETFYSLQKILFYFMS